MDWCFTKILGCEINRSQLLFHLQESLVDGIPVSLQDHTWHPMISEYLQVQSLCFICSFWPLCVSKILAWNNLSRPSVPISLSERSLDNLKMLEGVWYSILFIFSFTHLKREQLRSVPHMHHFSLHKESVVPLVLRTERPSWARRTLTTESQEVAYIYIYI